MSARAAPIRIVVGEGEAKGRLDKLVADRLAALGVGGTRSQVQRWIEAGAVSVDGRTAKGSEKPRRGAVVEVTPLPPEPTTAEPDATVPFRVLFEDAHLLVLDKPAGVVVHPARGHASGTLVNGLLARGSFDREVHDERDPAGKLRPGIVHRLDKDTSGVMVVAKDERTREGLKALFAAHDLERAYVALVVGKGTLATWDTTHARHPKDRLKWTTRAAEGRRAVTHVRVLEPLARGRAALVECRLDTGRTHQIRVHLAERAGTPILGDALYGRTPRDADLAAVAKALGRQALHARVLGFVHPVTRAKLRFESEPPVDFARALAALRALG